MSNGKPIFFHAKDVKKLVANIDRSKTDIVDFAGTDAIMLAVDPRFMKHGKLKPVFALQCLEAATPEGALQVKLDLFGERTGQYEVPIKDFETLFQKLKEKGANDDNGYIIAEVHSDSEIVFGCGIREVSIKLKNEKTNKYISFFDKHENDIKCWGIQRGIEMEEVPFTSNALGQEITLIYCSGQFEFKGKRFSIAIPTFPDGELVGNVSGKSDDHGPRELVSIECDESNYLQKLSELVDKLKAEA